MLTYGFKIHAQIFVSFWDYLFNVRYPQPKRLFTSLFILHYFGRESLQGGKSNEVYTVLQRRCYRTQDTAQCNGCIEWFLLYGKKNVYQRLGGKQWQSQYIHPSMYLLAKCQPNANNNAFDNAKWSTEQKMETIC